MARKKKQTRKKAADVDKRSAFWPLAGSLLLMVAAVFLLLGGFGAGGPLPISMFDGVYWALGWVAYLSPLALLFWGGLKFASEDRQIPIGKLTSMLSFLVLSAAWTHTAFVSVDEFTGLETGGNGGAVGRVIGGTTMMAISKVPASLLFFVLALLAFFFTFAISPQVLLKLLGLFKREHSEDTDLSALKAKADEHEFKLNEGVPVMHRGVASLKETAQKLTPNANREALTVASDPDWKFPSVDLLNQKQDKADAGDIEGNARAIKDMFKQFNLNVEMEGANIGPRVTQYTLKPPTGVKLSKITALDNNLALDLAAHSIRIEAPIPGKKLVGIEVPNVKPATVRISSVMLSPEWQDMRGPLSFAIGKDISGNSIVGDLGGMPHLLIAGQTGSGKSIMINTILTSLLYRNSPSDLKLILVDPKRVELKPYDEIPHLLTPVITEPEKCISALKWTVAEMERRYRALSEVHRRNIAEYNALKKEEGMPYIVVVIDELADLMMMAARDVESLIVRIAQKARAVGIHLIVATQSPRVTVITGLIKANIPARIAFTVSQEVESRIILDQSGAEKLHGKGDMLLLTADMPRSKRVQGALITDEETSKVTDFLRDQRAPEYDDEVVSQPVQLNGRGGIVADYGANEADDDMWKDAVRVVIESRKASTSLLQRRLRIGYGRAARLIETMEEQGIIGHADGNKPREVLVTSLDAAMGGTEETTSPEGDVYDDMDDPKDEYLSR